MRKDLIASLDVGTANTRCILAEVDQRGEVHVVGMCQRPSAGMRKGLIVDVEASAQAIRDTISFAERMAGGTVSSVYVALSPLHASLQASRGMVAVLSENHEVSPDDVDRVIEAAKVVSLPPNREIVDIISRQYIVDGYGGLKDPISMVGMRLELDALLVVGNLTALSNLRRSIERAGYSVASFVLKPLALGELLLTEDERELGVQLVDIGASVTEMAYFEEGTLRGIGVLPVGGASASNDLALGLKISTSTADKLKVDVDWFSMPDDKGYDLQAFGHVESRRVTSRSILDILEPRYEELFKMIRQQGKEMSSRDTIPAGYVLTGGTAKSRSFSGLARHYLANSVRINLDTYGAVDDPGYNAAIAVITYVLARQGAASGSRKQGKSSQGLLSKVKGFLKDFWE